MVRRLRRDGRIRPSTSGHAAPICPVRKGDGSLRVCVDYRQLNGKTKDTEIPSGNLQGVIESLSGAKFLASWTWQEDILSSANRGKG